MNRPHFRRHPRTTDPEPEYSRLDRLDGLPGRTRYDAEWPSVLAAEARAQERIDFPLLTLPADQSGFTALADWPVWDYGEGYEIEPEERAAVRPAHRARHAWTPPVAEADVEALGDLIRQYGDIIDAVEIARDLLATGRVSVTR